MSFELKWGYVSLNFGFEGVYRWFYGRKFRFTATRSGAVKRTICERKTTDIRTQIENFKTLIP